MELPLKINQFNEACFLPGVGAYLPEAFKKVAVTRSDQQARLTRAAVVFDATVMQWRWQRKQRSCQ
jgi:hypothetical protein